MRHLKEFDEFDPKDFDETSIEKGEDDLKSIGFKPMYGWLLSVEYWGENESGFSYNAIAAEDLKSATRLFLREFIHDEEWIEDNLPVIDGFDEVEDAISNYTYDWGVVIKCEWSGLKCRVNKEEMKVIEAGNPLTALREIDAFFTNGRQMLEAHPKGN
jgi:hypothetical protein